MSEVVNRFATSQPRVEILAGLLAYRARLRAIGITEGFQWLDGSFVEDVENSRGRPPADIDVVTFARRIHEDTNAWSALVQANLDLFLPTQSKAVYSCDAYFVDLGMAPEQIVRDTAYWFGLFSHQRTSALWKGMLLVSLNSDDDLAGQML